MIDPMQDALAEALAEVYSGESSEWLPAEMAASKPMQAIARVVDAAVSQVDEWHGDEVHDGYCERPLCLSVLALRGNEAP